MSGKIAESVSKLESAVNDKNQDKDKITAAHDEVSKLLKTPDDIKEFNKAISDNNNDIKAFKGLSLVKIEENGSMTFNSTDGKTVALNKDSFTTNSENKTEANKAKGVDFKIDENTGKSTYTIDRGDTIWGVAERICAERNPDKPASALDVYTEMNSIIKENPQLKDPDRIKEGRDTLTLPTTTVESLLAARKAKQQPVTPVTENQNPPVNNETTPPVSENQNPPITDKPTPPISDQNPPVTNKTTPPISDQNPPVIDKTTTPVKDASTTEPKIYPNGNKVEVNGNTKIVTVVGNDKATSVDDVVYTREGNGPWKRNKMQIEGQVEIDEKTGAVTELTSNAAATKLALENPTPEQLEAGRQFVMANYKLLCQDQHGNQGSALNPYQLNQRILNPDAYKNPLPLDESQKAYLAYLSKNVSTIKNANYENSWGEYEQLSLEDVNNWTHGELYAKNAQDKMKLSQTLNDSDEQKARSYFELHFTDINGPNGDAVLTLPEIANYVNRNGANGNKSLSEDMQTLLSRYVSSRAEERRQFVSQNFADIDSDSDGFLNDNELYAYSNNSQFKEKYKANIEKYQAILTQLKQESFLLRQESNDESGAETTGISMRDVNNNTLTHLRSATV